MNASTDVRDHLVRALEADIVGPFAGWDATQTAVEILPLPPARWYLTGFLAPQEGRDTEDPTSDEELGAGSDEDILGLTAVGAAVHAQRAADRPWNAPVECETFDTGVSCGARHFHIRHGCANA